MHSSSVSLSLSQATATATSSSISGSRNCNARYSFKAVNLRFCGLRRQAFGFSSSLTQSYSQRVNLPSRRRFNASNVSASLSGNGTPKSCDYDLIIIGAGVGGHGAALHAVEKVLPLIFVFANLIKAQLSLTYNLFLKKIEIENYTWFIFNFTNTIWRLFYLCDS